jgi:hypothetical protein
VKDCVARGRNLDVEDNVALNGKKSSDIEPELARHVFRDFDSSNLVEEALEKRERKDAREMKGDRSSEDRILAMPLMRGQG